MKTLALALATTALAATAATAASVADYDANGDRFASFAEVTAVNATVSKNDFRTIDTNRDRRLSAAEVQAPGAEVILKNGQGGTAKVLSVSDLSGGSFVSEGQLAAAYPGLSASEFDIIDLNNDNRVHASELYASAAQDILSEHESGGGILVSLDAVDTDGSGFASLAELQTVYPGTSANDLRVFDVNRDGRISFNEFYAPAAIEVLGKNK